MLYIQLFYSSCQSINRLIVGALIFSITRGKQLDFIDDKELWLHWLDRVIWHTLCGLHPMFFFFTAPTPTEPTSECGRELPSAVLSLSFVSSFRFICLSFCRTLLTSLLVSLWLSSCSVSVNPPQLAFVSLPHPPAPSLSSASVCGEPELEGVWAGVQLAGYCCWLA